MRQRFCNMLQLMGLITLACTSPAAIAVAWERVEGKTIALFYPGQASWEWLLTDHSAAKSVRKGAPCRECHEKEEKDMGNLIAKGAKLEPTPIDGKPGLVEITVQTAFDDDKFYLRAQWRDTGFRPKIAMDHENQVKFALMLDDGKVKEAAVAGCWGACHADATHMPAHTGSKARTLYLSASREKVTRNGGGDDLKPATDIRRMYDEGAFLEYWQARTSVGKPTVATGGYILDQRHEYTGKIVEATANLKNGTWTVEFARQRRIGAKGYKDLDETKVYNVGFALHDAWADERFHYVSFGHTLALGEQTADLTAKKQ